MEVTTTPHKLGNTGFLIINAGPDALYVGESNVDEDNGVRLLSGEGVSVGGTAWDIYVVSAGTSTVATLGEGMGMYSPPAVAEEVDLSAYELISSHAADMNSLAESFGDAIATKQPLDSDLTAIAALATTSYGRALLELANAAAADWVTKALFDANTTLVAHSDNTPVAVAISTNQVVGRGNSGNIKGMTPAEIVAVISSEMFTQPQGFNAQTGTSYTLVASDAGKNVTLSNAAAITLTVPQDSDATIAIGTYLDLYQLGAGQVTVVAGTGATLRVSGLTAKARAQYSRLGLQKVSANTWSLFGDLASS